VLCSKCSEVVKPVVAIDIDGTMGDYHAHFLNFAVEYFGEPATDWWGYSGHGKFSEWFMQAFDCDYRSWQDCKLAYRQGGMKRSMPPFTSIVQFAREAALYRRCEIWVTTTRPFLRLDNIDPDTREWLRRNNVHYSGLIYDDDKYEALAERIDKDRIIAVYDDLPEMYDSAEDVFGEDVPFLVSTQWNRNVYKPHMGGAQLAMHHLVTNLNKWRSVHDEAAVA
jgi:hypothetical protein